MHADYAKLASEDRKESYEYLLMGLEGLIVDHWVANLANAASLLWYHFQNYNSQVNWAGFYVTDGDMLVLGPFQGKPACQTIRFGVGVCGVAAETRKTQLVSDVHEFPGHIACDGDTNSEVVIPILKDDKVLGVLDLDCVVRNGFDELDVFYLEKIAKLMVPSLMATADNYAA